MSYSSQAVYTKVCEEDKKVGGVAPQEALFVAILRYIDSIHSPPPTSFSHSFLFTV